MLAKGDNEAYRIYCNGHTISCNIKLQHDFLTNEKQPNNCLLYSYLVASFIWFVKTDRKYLFGFSCGLSASMHTTPSLVFFKGLITPLKTHHPNAFSFQLTAISFHLLILFSLSHSFTACVDQVQLILLWEEQTKSCYAPAPS